MFSRLGNVLRSQCVRTAVMPVPKKRNIFTAVTRATTAARATNPALIPAQTIRRSQIRTLFQRDLIRFDSEEAVFAAAGAIAIGGVVLVGGVYIYMHLESTPMANRTRFIGLSESAEESLGKETMKEVMAKYDGKFFPQNHPTTLRVERIARRLIEKTPLRDKPWTFHVVHTSEMNCFVLPGRHVFVFEGMLPLLESDDAMAAVLGHEIAHVYARHAAERLSLRYIVVGLALMASMVVDISPYLRNSILTLGLELPFSRKMESEADYIGLRLMSECCYDAREAPQVFEQLEKHSGSKVPAFLTTHPSNDARIAQIKKWLPEMKQVKAKNCEDMVSFETFYQQKQAAQRYNDEELHELKNH